MAAVTFDTLKFVETLQSAGVPEVQAKAFARAFAEAQREADVATKGDIGLLRQEIAGVAEPLRREIADAKTDIIKWMAGLLIAQAAVIAALVKLL
jgi:UDP:flavonoid glycosyltransferase YjiC (YdhE family)